MFIPIKLLSEDFKDIQENNLLIYYCSPGTPQMELFNIIISSENKWYFNSKTKYKS